MCHQGDKVVAGAVKDYSDKDSEKTVLSLFRNIRAAEEDRINIAAGLAGAGEGAETAEGGVIKETANLYVIKHQESITTAQDRLIATRHMIGARRKGGDNVYMLTGFFGNPASDNYAAISEVDTEMARFTSRRDVIHGGTANAAFAMVGAERNRMLYLYYQSGIEEIAGMLRVGEEKEEMRHSTINDMFLQGYRENGIVGALVGIEQYASTSYDQHVVVINPKISLLNNSSLELPGGDVVEVERKKEEAPTCIMYNNAKLGVFFISFINRDPGEEDSYATKGAAPMIERVVQERPLPSWRTVSDDRMFS